MRDDAFIRGAAPMTKEEIRAIALSKLALHDSVGLLDIGAGTGSVSIEAKVMYKALPVTAVEQDQQACVLIKANCDKFQIKDMTILEGRAPKVDVLGTYDRFFIGGSEGELEAILTWVRELGTGDCTVVVTCITLETQMEAYGFLCREPFFELEAIQVNIQKLENLGRYHYYKPGNGITIYTAHFKGEQS
jgi:cobalt-precorrin-6B (C15)-methyltransferase